MFFILFCITQPLKTESLFSLVFSRFITTSLKGQIGYIAWSVNSTPLQLFLKKNRFVINEGYSYGGLIEIFCSFFLKFFQKTVSVNLIMFLTFFRNLHCAAIYYSAVSCHFTQSICSSYVACGCGRKRKKDQRKYADGWLERIRFLVCVIVILKEKFSKN